MCDQTFACVSEVGEACRGWIWRSVEYASVQVRSGGFGAVAPIGRKFTDQIHQLLEDLPGVTQLLHRVQLRAPNYSAVHMKQLSATYETIERDMQNHGVRHAVAIVTVCN